LLLSSPPNEDSLGGAFGPLIAPLLTTAAPSGNFGIDRKKGAVMELTPVMEKFIVRWGEMGGIWGINRASAQIVALLYLSREPITAETISETLSLARSTVSTDLRELQNWGVIKVVHVLGDRRDHFETLSDPGELFRVIVRENKRRMVDPLAEMLRDGVVEAGKDDDFIRERMRGMLDLVEVFSAMYDRTEEIPTDMLLKMAKQTGQLPMKTALKLAQLGDGLGESLKRLVK
jgi:DNA-binding transcriptional regulator GbsR (MarR family)